VSVAAGPPAARVRRTTPWLLAALAALVPVALLHGAVEVTLRDLAADPLARTIVLELRAPRVCAALLVGAGLAVAGATLQALFRNPLADPALIGVSGGAALGAATVLTLPLGALALGRWPVAGAAFAGALVAVALVWRLGRVHGRLLLAAVLLAGIALNTLTGALVGLLLFVADDPALRSVTFWLLGSLAETGWPSLLPLAAAVLPAVLLLERRARHLDLYQLGDLEARHAGLDVQAIQRLGLLLGALATAVAVATAGIIGFVGLIVPHMVRMTAGPGHRGLIRDAALAGALLLLLADLLARTLLAPVELPVGLLTALAGGPFFLWLLRREAGREAA